MERGEKDAPYSQRHVCALRIVLLVLFKQLPALSSKVLLSPALTHSVRL